MENFNTDQKLHLSKFLKEDDPLYPCREQAAQHKGDCYLYAPTYYLRLHPQAYTDALQWCKSAEPAYVSACVQGVGSQAMKEHIAHPKLVEDLCTRGNDIDARACLSGMVGLYINHYGSLEPARKLCEQFEPANRQTCTSSVQAAYGLFVQ